MILHLPAAAVKLRDDWPGYCYQGVWDVFGASHHVRLIRVKDATPEDPDPMVEPPDDAPAAVKALFQDGQNYYDGAYECVTVPDLPGRYAMFVFPFAY